MLEDRNAILIDVRTAAEWTFVGTPDLSRLGREPLLLSWALYPDMRPNSEFLDKLRTAPGRREGTPMLFLCRSGARSRAAAVAAAGLGPAYNIAGGFEGDLDGARHRGSSSGWKVAGLPWVQG